MCRSHNLMAILAAAGFLLSRFTFSATEDSLGGLARWRRGRRVQSLALAHDYPLLLSSAFATNTQETPAITACLFCSFLKPVTSPLRRSFKIFLLQNLPASKSTLTNLISVSWSRKPAERMSRPSVSLLSFKTYAGLLGDLSSARNLCSKPSRANAMFAVGGGG